MLIKGDYFFFGDTDLFYTAPDRFGPGWGDQSLCNSWLSICTCNRHISSSCTAVASLLQATKAVWRPGNETSTIYSRISSGSVNPEVTFAQSSASCGEPHFGIRIHSHSYSSSTL